MSIRELLAFATVSVAHATLAQVPGTPQTTLPQTIPATKIEAFSSMTGLVVIRGISTVGRVGGLGFVSIYAREARDASRPSQGVYGVAIEVKEAGRLERESRSFIDLDEIDSLVRGLDYLSKISKAVTQLNDVEVQYRTKGDFSITVYSDLSGGLSLLVDSGRIGKTSAFLKMSDLEALKTHILEAKRLVEAARTANK